MRLTGADIVIECLKEQGVDTVFGYPGGAVLNIYDALYREKDAIRHILPSHEQGAAHAADGYARSTGRVGVCMATSGPGATNLVTGIATAYMDSVPVVAITGNVPLAWLGKDSFQEVDISGITLPITKHNYIVKDVDKLAEVMRKAFHIAQEGRPGPVLIDIPKDITAALADYEPMAIPPLNPSTKRIRTEALDEAVELLTSCAKPLVYAGGGVIRSDAGAELRAFAERLQSPVTLSLMGIGGFPADHQLFTGGIGMHGTKTSNLASKHCDLLVAIGARFSDRVVSNVAQFAPNARILHIDVDPAEINKNVPAYHHINGDIRSVLERLNDRLMPMERPEWLKQIQTWKTNYPLYQEPANGETIEMKPGLIIRTLSDLTKGEAIVTTEVGQNQIWAAQHYLYTRPRTFLSSGGLGTMGYGLGAAIGAQIGNPDRRVIDIAGDGSFRMNCIELATAVEYELPIIVLILNNHALGMVRQWQDLFYDRRFSHSDLDRQTDFRKLAEAFGALGYHVTEPSAVKTTLAAALQDSLAEKRPAVVNCEIAREDKVYPIVPPGAAIDDVITEGE